jgi:uncharacterized protein
MPTVSRLSIAPVRSLGLEHRDEIRLEERGVLEDRRFFVIDANDRLIDQLIEGTLVQVKTWTDPDATELRMTFPDGTVVEDRVELAEPIETAIHSRTGVGHVVVGPWGAALSDFIGREVRIVRCDQPGGTRRAHPATLVTDGSIEALAGVLGAGDIDARRFRMLIELEGGRAHEEDTWVGCRVGLGDAILRISAPVPRCAMTTHDPATGHRDLDTLRAIKDYRGLVNGKDLMFGVWGEVEQPGTIRLGDRVDVLGA